MAGVAEKVQAVSTELSGDLCDGDSELTFTLPAADTSLQELIDSELALRIGNVVPDNVEQGVGESSEHFLMAERCHTSANLKTLNVFSDTIDLSPDCEPPSPLFPRSPLIISPQYENRSFVPSDLDDSEVCKLEFSAVDSEESPITEDASDLEPIPLFTQTITSDNEQSPLAETSPCDLGAASSIDELLVVIEPPDDSTPHSSDSPERPASPKEIQLREMELMEKLEDTYSGQRSASVESEHHSKIVENPYVEGLFIITDSKINTDSHSELSTSTGVDGSVEEAFVIVESETNRNLIGNDHNQEDISVKGYSLVNIESKPIGDRFVEEHKLVNVSVKVDSPVVDESKQIGYVFLEDLKLVDVSVKVDSPVVVEAKPIGDIFIEDHNLVDVSCKVDSPVVVEFKPIGDMFDEDHNLVDISGIVDSPVVDESKPMGDMFVEDHNLMDVSVTTNMPVVVESNANGDLLMDQVVACTGDSVDASVCNSMRSESVSVVSNTEPLSEWTTVEEATKGVQELEPQPTAVPTEDLPPLHNNITESMTTTTTTTKTVKKKKSTEGVDTTSTRTKKTKKTKKSEEKENHISVMANGHSGSVSPEEGLQSPVSVVSSLGDEDELGNVCVRDLRRSFCDIKKACDSTPSPVAVNGNQLKSSFSKFDQLQKKSVLHVRSSDASKLQKQFNQDAAEVQGANPTCKSCGKTVFAMEQVKAERSVWHKNCFRCKECSKQLTVDIYQSHEGELYCKPHFKELFKPKAVLDSADDEPPSDKADLGLEELSSLNVKSRFQVFEKTSDTEVERSMSTVNVKRSPSILSKLAKFQKKGMDVGVTDETLNGVDYEESSSSEEEAQGEDGAVVKSSKVPERPVSFNKMEDVKRTWESSGATKTKDEMRAEHKKEINQIRSRLFQGKQGKMKEMYEQAVAESEGKVVSKNQDVVQSEKARLLKERFERGEVAHSEDEDEEEKRSKTKEAEDLSVFEAGISKKSRSIFLELDATAAKTQTSPLTPSAHALTPRTTQRRSSQTEDSPAKEVYRDPNVVRGEDVVEDESIVKRSQTASRMLSLFRQMEEQKEPVPDGPKPLKCFTPPPDYKEDQTGSSEEEEEESEEEEQESEDDTRIIKSSAKIEDEFLKQAQTAARAKALKEKFEHWEPEKQSINNAINFLESEQESIETTKSLRARFESLKAEQPKEKSCPKVNRFVQEAPVTAIKCVACDKTVYPLEKVEVSGKIYHTHCFRCQQCQCRLRMDTFTWNNDHLYCLPHFRQLFISKGNYDEGFGSNQHKTKWQNTINGHH